MAINVNIGAIHIDRLVVSDNARGASPEFLKEVGFDIAEDAPEQPVDDSPTIERSEEEVLQDWGERVEPIPDHVMPFTRRDQLYHAIKKAADYRRLRGAVTTSQETRLHDLDGARKGNERLAKIFAESLGKACGMCEFQGNCRLEGNGPAWLRRHPHKDRLTNHREQESIQDFEARLDKDPMAHCMTPGQPKEPAKPIPEDEV